MLPRRLKRSGRSARHRMAGWVAVGRRGTGELVNNSPFFQFQPPLGCFFYRRLGRLIELVNKLSIFQFQPPFGCFFYRRLGRLLIPR